jgi:hypothetical protein
MRHTEQIYQSILHHLSLVPTDKLSDIEEYLRLLRLRNMTPEEKKANAEFLLSQAGTWDDMPEADFQDFLKEAKRIGNEAFSREVDI